MGSRIQIQTWNGCFSAKMLKSTLEPEWGWELELEPWLEQKSVPKARRKQSCSVDQAVRDDQDSDNSAKPSQLRNFILLANGSG